MELFHHSKDISATIDKLEAVLDKGSGEVMKKNPRCACFPPAFMRTELIQRRMLTRGSSARIHVQLRAAAGGANRRSTIPLETFAMNKSMGRVLFRRGGETIAAGIVTELGPS